MSACRGFWNTSVIRGCGTCRKSKLLRHFLARPGPWQIFVFLDFHSENGHCFLLETWTAGTCTTLHESVLGQVDVPVFLDKHCHPKASASRPECDASHNHTRSLRLSLALAMVPTMNTPTIQENTSFEWNGILTQRVKGYWYGSYSPYAYFRTGD